MSDIWSAYSEEFQDAYDRFENNLDDEDTFNDMVNKFNDWINISRRMKGEPTIQPTLRQIQALAERAYTERNLEDLSVEVIVPDRRFKSGFRRGFRDVASGRVKPHRREKKDE